MLKKKIQIHNCYLWVTRTGRETELLLAEAQAEMSALQRAMLKEVDLFFSTDSFRHVLPFSSHVYLFFFWIPQSRRILGSQFNVLSTQTEFLVVE